MNKITNTLSFIRQHGALNFSRELFYRIYDTFYERLLAVKTSRFMTKDELQVSNDDAVEYSPIGYFAIAAALKKVPSISDRSLLDYGCGMGRVLAYSARLGLKRVIGVELSPELHTMAKANINSMRGRETQDISVFNTNAITYEVPEDIDVIYFYNPFYGETLKKVLSNILQSHKKHPREIYIIFFNNEHFEKIINSRLVTKIFEQQYSQYYNCAIYKIAA